jgi:cation diffusion facilitator CzcD-associated flavoprotein CzcO
MTACDVAIVGAGPYGLSAAAHLEAADGLRIRIFGEAMSFWDNHMPVGMLLRSPLEGSNLSDPGGRLGLQAYHQASSEKMEGPLPLKRFTTYGRWFQSRAVPHLDSRKIAQIRKTDSGFQLAVEDGDLCHAKRVVVAAGILPFAWCPPVFRGLPSSLASHSCAHRDLRGFEGKRVAVIGAGQSALESAALMHEAGVHVEMFVRAPNVRWLWRRPWVHTFRPVARMLYAPPDVGQAGISHLVARPNLFRRLPRSIQDRLGPRSIRPAGAAWLKPRCSEVRMTMRCEVKSAVAAQGRVKLHLSDGSERIVDHVLLATGYRMDIARYPFLSENLLSAVERVGGYPKLDLGFESTVSGLYFLGAPAAWSFGPLMRFVAGADFASKTLAKKILQQVKSNGNSD